jgi:hypothetical protein
MPLETNPYYAYKFAVAYGSDAETTTVNVKLMTFDRGKFCVGHQFTTPPDRLDLFIDRVRQAIGGVDVTGDLADGSPLSIQRMGDSINFSAPVKLIGNLTRVLDAPMTVADATRMADELDAVQDAINTFLDAGVRFSLSGDTPTPMAFVTDDEPTHVR